MFENLKKIGKIYPWQGKKGEIEEEIENKEKRWHGPHSLNIYQDYQQTSPFVKGEKLILGYYINSQPHQYFITDKTSTLEFCHNDDWNEKAVQFHNNPNLSYIISESEFACDSGVLERINEVLGATNFSLALRNSEHVARYVHCGAWISHQMASGKLREGLNKEMTAQVQKLVNTLPEELVKSNKYFGVPIHKEIQNNYIKFEKNMEFLCNENKDSFNIVLLGITGSGKSRLINLLFNEEVTRSASTPVSVTRNVHYIQGTYIANDNKPGFLPSDNDEVELGLDILCQEHPEEYSQSSKLQNDSLSWDDQTDDMKKILAKIETVEEDIFKKGSEWNISGDIMRDGSSDNKQKLRTTIAKAVEEHEKTMELHIKCIEHLNQYAAEIEKTDSDSICVVDTLGLCDTKFTFGEVYDKISSSVKTQMAFIDKVVIVCSGRIESATAEAIRQYMDWMQYETHPKNFVFVYNKCEDMTEAEKKMFLESVCELLGVDMSVEDILTYPDGSQEIIKYVQATSFPLHLEYSALKEDLDSLKQAIFKKTKSRIKIDTKNRVSCTII